jgi:hypothetical protein
MAAAAVAVNVRRLALDLHTDIVNLEGYAGQPALVAALLETAENKVAIIMEHLAAVRSGAGLTGGGVVLHMVREG